MDQMQILMAKDISVLFLNMNEKEPEITTTTVKDRAVVFAERYLERVATQFGYGSASGLQKIEDTQFVIVGGIRSQPEPHDIGNAEAQVKQVVISLLAEGEYIGLAAEFFASLGLQMYGNNLLQKYFTQEFLEQHILTETELRQQLAQAESNAELLQHDSITTAANLDVIVEIVKRLDEVSSLEFVSSPEHLFRIEALWQRLIKQLGEHEDTVLLAEQLRSIDVHVASEAEFINLEYRTTARKLRDMVTEIVARPFLETDRRLGTNLYGLLEKNISSERKQLN